MDLSDLDPDELAPVLGDRAVRTYPALLSTEADALGWARAGAPPGAVVVADYQASPRGRAGLPWQVHQGEGLGFSLIVHPGLPAAREGWLYVVGTAALADAAGDGHDDVAVEWPDTVVADGTRLAAVGVTTELTPQGTVAWAVVNALVEGIRPPRGPALAGVIESIEDRLRQDPDELLDGLRPRCATLGRRVRTRLIPMGPTGVVIEGRAVDLLRDGALSIETDSGARVAVLPHHLGFIEDADEDADAQ